MAGGEVARPEVRFDELTAGPGDREPSRGVPEQGLGDAGHALDVSRREHEAGLAVAHALAHAARFVDEGRHAHRLGVEQGARHALLVDRGEEQEAGPRVPVPVGLHRQRAEELDHTLELLAEDHLAQLVGVCGDVDAAGSRTRTGTPRLRRISATRRTSACPLSGAMRAGA